MKIEQLVVELDKNKIKVFDKIGQESIDVYLFIEQQFKEPTVSRPVFEFVYRSFYRLDSAGLTDEWKNVYFDYLFAPSLRGLKREKAKIELEKILENFHRIPTIKGHQSIQFSFATKLLHTLNPSLPIYDSLIKQVVTMPTMTESTSKARIAKCITAYEALLNSCDELLENKEVMNLISQFKNDYNVREMSDAKALDFLLWGLAKVKEKE